MPVIPTVRGPVELGELGMTLMHEHIFVLDPEALTNYGHLWGAHYWDEEVRVADAIAKLRRAREGGVRTLVDPTVPGLGRDIRRVQRINAEVDLHIVVATGLYAFLQLPGFLAPRSDDFITELFVRELRTGIDDTGVRAAFLKCVVEAGGLIGDVPRIVACIAAAAVETGAPVMVHTNSQARTGLVALDALTGHGVDPRTVVIAHAGDSNDLDYLRALADTGAQLGLDRWGIDHFNPTEERLRTTLALLELGLVDQLHLSHDAACFYDFMHHNPFFADERPDYLLLTETIIPELLARGATPAQIEQMTVANPQAYFA